MTEQKFTYLNYAFIVHYDRCASEVYNNVIIIKKKKFYMQL